MDEMKMKMAENKNSFLLYCDTKHMVDKLTNEQAGKLFKHILDYVNDENPTLNDLLLEVAFEPIKQYLKRDLERYQRIVERNRENGKKGGRPKKTDNQKNKQNPENPLGYLETQRNPEKPKKADSDSDSDSVNDINNISPTFEDFWIAYDKKVGKKKSKELWVKVSQKDREALMEYIPKYKQAKLKGYRKDPERFLRHEVWNDEIIQSGDKKPPPSKMIVPA